MLRCALRHGLIVLDPYREGVPNYDHPLITTKKIRWRLTSPGNVTIDVLALLRVLLRIKRLTKKRKAVLRPDILPGIKYSSFNDYSRNMSI